MFACSASRGAILGAVAIADTVKKGAPAAVAALQRQGVEVWMVTGDNRLVAQAIAGRIGISRTRVLAGVKPSQKAQTVLALQNDGHTVAMVGDGVNDSPALAQADVGIAVGAGTDVAVEAADVVLVHDDPTDVATTIDLSKQTLRRIRLNFVWALAYNAVGIPLAAGALYPAFMLRIPPMFAGLAMAFSSVSVVVSSLLLKNYKPPNYERDLAGDDVDADPYFDDVSDKDVEMGLMRDGGGGRGGRQRSGSGGRMHMGVGRGGKRGYMVLDEDGEAEDGEDGGAGAPGRELLRAEMARLRRLRNRRAAKHASEPGYVRLRTKHVLLCAAAACFGLVLMLVIFGVAGNPFMIHASEDDTPGWDEWCANHHADATALGAPCKRAVPGHVRIIRSYRVRKE